MSKEQDLRDVLNLPVELDDFKQVLIQAAKSGKYPPNDWLKPEGGKQDRRTQFNSIMHHLVADLMGIERDEDSNLMHLEHAMCRIGMEITRRKRGITHPIDGKKAISNNTGKLCSHTTPFMQSYQDSTSTTCIRDSANNSYLDSIGRSLTRSGNECSLPYNYVNPDTISNDINKSKE